MLLIAFIALLVAGIVKGAIGSGVPVIVVPILTMLYDVQLAIALLVAPNLFSNALQVWQYRRHLLPLRFLAAFSIAGGLGIVLALGISRFISRNTVTGCRGCDRALPDHQSDETSYRPAF